MNRSHLYEQMKHKHESSQAPHWSLLICFTASQLKATTITTCRFPESFIQKAIPHVLPPNVVEEHLVSLGPINPFPKRQSKMQCLDFSILDKLEEFLASFCGRAHAPQHARGYGFGGCFLDAAHDHAEMAGLDNDSDTLRLEDFGES